MTSKFPLILAATFGCAPLTNAANIIDSIYGIGAGSFELHDPDTSTYLTFESGSTALTGWTVGQNNLDWVNTAIWTASDGGYSLDMNGTAPLITDPPKIGSIYTTISTTAGSTYSVSFDVSGYLSHGNTTNPKELEVSVEAVSLPNVLTEISNLDVQFTATNNNPALPINLNWETHTFTFVATEANTRITFISRTTNNTSGILLDNVSVELVPEPGSTALLGAAGILLLSRRSRRP